MNGCWILLYAFNTSIQLSFLLYSVNVSNDTDILMLYQHCNNEINSIGNYHTSYPFYILKDLVYN